MSLDSEIKLAVTERPCLITSTGGKRIKWLVDTGASVSCLDSTVYEQIKTWCKTLPTPDKLSVNSATGHFFAIKGVANIPLTFEGRNINQPCLIVDGLKARAILGVDFLKANGVVYYGATNMVEIAQVEKEGTDQWYTREEMPCWATRSTVIPPRAATFISTRCALTNGTV
jgi:predicted aspartyl protease